MIETRQISVGYDETEDRIFLDCNDGEARVRLWLTRRITGRFLAAVAELLERSSPTLVKVPADMRQEAIAFEHQSALSVANASPDSRERDAESARFSDLGAVLLHRVDIEVLPQAFRLLFHDISELKAGLTINRTELHKTLALFAQSAQAGGWEVAGEWLKNPDSAMTSLDRSANH